MIKNNNIIIIILIGSLIFSGFVSAQNSILKKSDQSLNLFEDEYDMVIITPNVYSNNLIPLIDHKNSNGIKTYIKNVEDIENEFTGRDLAEKIKYFIKNSIEEFSIKYALLIGYTTDIPCRYTHIFFDQPFDYPTPEEWIFPSDFYYADIYNNNGDFSSWDSNNNSVFAEYHWNGNTDEIDLTPDIYIGRLACTNEEQINTCVNKIIEYESSSAWSEAWFTNLVLIAGDGIPFDDENIDESEYLQEFIIDIMDGFIPVKIWASNGGLSDAYNINDAINQGAGFVFFNGHGFHDLWATYLHNSNIWVPPGYYRTFHINQLNNSNKLPIVLSDACYHLQYDDYPDCFGWSFVSNPNGGAIAFIGGSDTDLAYAGSRIVEKGIEKLDLEICKIYQEGEQFLGDLWGKGLINYQPIEDDLVDIITILQNHLFGDPSLKIAGNSQHPIKPEPPIGPSECKRRTQYNFTAMTTDPDNDLLYYLFDWGDNSISNWIGPFESGIICNTSHIWKRSGSYEIKVKAKDDNGMQSEWSDPLEVSISKNKTIKLIDIINDLIDENSLKFRLLRQLIRL
jgi:hypothetical protein